MDHDKLRHSLKLAIDAHAPWFSGRLRKQNNAEIRNLLEVHYPPASETSVSPFSFSSRHFPGRTLQLVVPHVRSSTQEASVLIAPDVDIKALSPWADERNAVQKFIETDSPLVHLQIGECADGSIISLSVAHVLVDATSFGMFVQAWQSALKGAPNSIMKAESCELDCTVADNEEVPSKLYAFAKGLSRTWFLARFISYFLADSIRYRSSRGLLYLPDSLVRSWVNRVNSDLDGDDWVSRNDVVSAWVFKYALSAHPDSRRTSLLMMYTLRGRHPQIPTSAAGNASAAVFVYNPPVLVGQLRTQTLAETALSIRRFVNTLGPKQAEKSVASELRRLQAGQAIPDDVVPTVDTRFLLMTNLTKMGFPFLDFSPCLIRKGNESGKVVATVPFGLDMSHIFTLVEDVDGGLTLHGRLPTVYWGRLRDALNAGH